MRHRVAGRHLSRTSSHRLAMRRNMVASLFEHETISTTLPKAKEVRGFAEKMITLGKAGTLPARRQALAFIIDKKVVEKLFDTLAPKYAERAGGYTRIIKLGPRLGDGAATVQLELVE